VEGAGDASGTSSSGEEEDRRWQREAKLHAAEAARRAYSAAASGGWIPCCFCPASIRGKGQICFRVLDSADESGRTPAATRYG
jgi:hypothetical protein